MEPYLLRRVITKHPPIYSATTMTFDWRHRTFPLRSSIGLACAAITIAAAPLSAQQEYWGQTFAAPTTPNMFLQSVSVNADGFTGYSYGGDTFTAQIFAVDASGLTGPSLFSQLLGSSYSGFTLTPNIAVTSGGLYGVVVNVGTFAANTDGDNYAGGNGVVCGGTVTGCQPLFSSPNSPADDLSGFKVVFGTVDTPPDPASTTPEPASVALLATGLVGLVPAVRRRKR